MTANTQREISEMKRELKSIITEIEAIEKNLRTDFIGIGSNVCASRLKSLLNDRLYKAQKSLNNMNTSIVTDEFLANQSNK
ncbi:MAG: hypothetical protein LBC71_08750 [Oscillospiraceae bacterium]|jgi:hypothetical protein|nr:hypothetical protein [Oscillospiraceae bacterium]